MNQNDKVVLKAQLTGVNAQLGAVATMAQGGASMPIVTPSGPAAAPGLMQIGQAITMQNQALQQLSALIGKIIDAA